MYVPEEIKIECIPSYGDLFTLEDWEAACESGCFVDYDGFGNFATETKCSKIIISPSDRGTTEYERMKTNFTHVVWYSK